MLWRFDLCKIGVFSRPALKEPRRKRLASNAAAAVEGFFLLGSISCPAEHIYPNDTWGASDTDRKREKGFFFRKQVKDFFQINCIQI